MAVLKTCQQRWSHWAWGKKSEVHIGVDARFQREVEIMSGIVGEGGGATILSTMIRAKEMCDQFGETVRRDPAMITNFAVLS